MLATIRAWDYLDTSNAVAYVFVAGIAGLFVELLALEWYMLGRRSVGRLSPPGCLTDMRQTAL